LNGSGNWALGTIVDERAICVHGRGIELFGKGDERGIRKVHRQIGVRCPTLFTRMQASTKASTLGLACLLIGAALQLGDFASFIRIVSIGAFILPTTPVAVHVIARASYLADVPLWDGTVLDERRRESSGMAHQEQQHDPRAKST
jgi:monovalent cation/proton antiporter MnhG/PhaG subunit